MDSAGGTDGGIGGSGTGGDGYEVIDCPATYQNPIMWEDLPDLEVIRVGEAYYYTASTFHHSPGAPLLRSYDLVNWEYISHSVPVMDVHPMFDLEEESGYHNGIWASTLGYRESNETFYWMGCMFGGGGGYAFTATSPTGPWEKHATQHCYYDMGLLVDDDDTMYVAWGAGTINVAQLSPDGFSEVKREAVFETPESVGGPLEGSRFYKIGEYYYIFVTQHANGEYVLRSTDPFGPYEYRPFAVRLPFAGSGAGGAPHQGGIVQTHAGDWYYIAFNDSFPGGRLPVMAPFTWTEDGWPELELVDGQWGAEYPFPDVTCRKVPPRPNLDTFSEPELRHEWEWNHNPDDSKWSAGDGLTLQTATVTTDIYEAKNTLTRRIEGPISVATIELDYSGMQDGDIAGLAAWRDSIAWIGIKKEGENTSVVMKENMDLQIDNWENTTPGTEVASQPVSGGTIWLRMEGNIRTDPGGGTAKFSYSLDGSSFTPLGGTFEMERSWNYFLGYRFGLFNYAEKSLGGQVNIASFSVETL